MNYAAESAAGVSPVGLVIRLYENIAAGLGRAIIAVRDGDIEKRTNQLQHVLLLIAHLENALDFEKGGDPARWLRKFYTMARARILEAQLKQSGKILEELMANFLSIREAWEEVDKQSQSAMASSSPAGSDPSSWVA